MKILCYISSMGKGGAERVLSYLLEALVQDNEITLLTDRKLETEYAVPEQVRRINIGEYPSSGLLTPLLRKRWRLRRICEVYRELQPDTAVGFMGKNAVRLLMAAGREPGYFVAAIRMNPVHEFGTGLSRQLLCRVMNRADLIVCQTQEQVHYFPQRLQRKAMVIKNPIGTQFCIPVYEGPRTAEIVAVGRLDENKNHQLLIRAFAQLADSYPQMKLMIYGEGESRAQLEQLIRELGLESRITLPGIVGNIPQQIRRARVYVLCSVSEGIPNSLLEAMALGLPVIATDCEGGAAGELIQHGENGYLIPNRDLEALARQLEYVLQHEEEALRIGRLAAGVQEKYSLQSITESWKRVINPGSGGTHL